MGCVLEHARRLASATGGGAMGTSCRAKGGKQTRGRRGVCCGSPGTPSGGSLHRADDTLWAYDQRQVRSTARPPSCCHPPPGQLTFRWKRKIRALWLSLVPSRPAPRPSQTDVNAGAMPSARSTLLQGLYPRNEETGYSTRRVMRVSRVGCGRTLADAVARSELCPESTGRTGLRREEGGIDGPIYLPAAVDVCRRAA